jgi:N-acetylglucosamine kinase-like BadF-type ATPase
MPSPLFIGLDVGGSKTALLARAGQETLERTGAGVNVQRDGVEGSAAELATLIADVLAALDHDGTGSICLGAAGAGRREDQEALATQLRQRIGSALGACTLTVEHDAYVALEAAFAGESGMIVIAGTGSVVLARTEAGTLERAGGWGPRIGDDGSGVAIGSAGLGAVAAAFDGGEPTVLRDRLAEAYAITTPEDLIHAVYRTDWTVQDVAPLVVAAAEAGDWASTRILKTQANALAQRAGWLLTRTTEPIAPRLALMGGLVGGAYYRESLADALQRHLSGWEVVRPSRRPVEGALALAEKMAAAAVETNQEMDSGG